MPLNIGNLATSTFARLGEKAVEIRLYTDAEKLLTDIDTLLFFEKTIRGGVSGVMGERYFKANEEYKLLYVDANNLYGWAMMEPQPHSQFKVITPDISIEDFTQKVLSIPDDNPIGYYYEVDLKYPDDIKFKSKNMPYCPEQIVAPDDWLSPYQKKLKPKISAKVANTK